MDSNERNAALKAATVQLDDVCRECGAESVVAYPVIGGLNVGYCEAHDPERKDRVTIKTHQDHADGLVAVIRSETSIVSVWWDGTATRTALTDEGEGVEVDITADALAGEVLI